MAKVDISKAITKIHALGNVLHRPLRDVLDSWARVTAISCAKETQPFGTGNEAQQKGRKAVARDILRVYALARDGYEDISSPRARAAFWKAYKATEFEVCERLLQDFGRKLSGVPMERFDGGSAHKSIRNKTTGRVPETTRHKMIVTDPKALFRYIDEEQDHVGTGKGGWADAVRAIGGNPRGLREDGDITASWITAKRKGGGYGAAYRGGTDENPTITIVNRVPYADHILSGGARNDAIRIGRERTILNLQEAVRAETRKLRSAA